MVFQRVSAPGSGQKQGQTLASSPRYRYPGCCVKWWNTGVWFSAQSVPMAVFAHQSMKKQVLGHLCIAFCTRAKQQADQGLAA